MALMTHTELMGYVGKKKSLPIHMKEDKILGISTRGRNKDS